MGRRTGPGHIKKTDALLIEITNHQPVLFTGTLDSDLYAGWELKGPIWLLVGCVPLVLPLAHAKGTAPKAKPHKKFTNDLSSDFSEF